MTASILKWSGIGLFAGLVCAIATIAQPGTQYDHWILPIVAVFLANGAMQGITEFADDPNSRLTSGLSTIVLIARWILGVTKWAFGIALVGALIGGIQHYLHTRDSLTFRAATLLNEGLSTEPSLQRSYVEFGIIEGAKLGAAIGAVLGVGIWSIAVWRMSKQFRISVNHSQNLPQ